METWYCVFRTDGQWYASSMDSVEALQWLRELPGGAYMEVALAPDQGE